MADGDREVLSSLPRTRPERRSGKRAPRPPARTPAGATTAKNVAKPKTTKTGARAKATSPTPKAVHGAHTAEGRGSVPIPPAGYAVPKTASPVNASGTELIGTAIQAVGELANLGTKALRGALSRLPRA
jgi:hypothetical protein